MNGKYIREYEVGARAITKDLILAPSDMFDLLQETATVHSDTLGYDMDFFIREQKGWALLSWRAEFERLPKWRERLTVETWPTKGRGIVANRNFRVLDSGGTPIMKAFSQWVYFDIVRRRPVKISGDMLLAYTSDVEDILPGDKIIVRTPTEDTKIAESGVTVMRSHTDSNFHVNNVTYIKWAEDNLPDSVFYNRQIKSILINYRKEAKIGDKLVIETFKTDSAVFTHIIRDLCGNTCTELVMNY